MQAQWVYSA